MPTIIIGGNHEAVVYMNSLPYGGWIAENMYYIGRSGVVRFGSLKIAGLSGIFHGPSYNKPLPENPSNTKDYKTLFRLRKKDTRNLFKISKPDIFMSHDWPRGIYYYGDVEDLLRKKKFLRADVEENSLGNPVSFKLLETLKP